MGFPWHELEDPGAGMDGVRWSIPELPGGTTLFLDHVAEQDHLPLLFHCAAGKDRTGFGAAILVRVMAMALLLAMPFARVAFLAVAVAMSVIGRYVGVARAALQGFHLTAEAVDFLRLFPVSDQELRIGFLEKTQALFKRLSGGMAPSRMRPPPAGRR